MNYTRFKKARILGARALQISLGASPMTKDNGKSGPIGIAELELGAGILPIAVTRS